MRVTHKRLLSLLLTLCMVISMASMLSVPAYAAYAEGEILGTTGTGTKEDPVVCNTFDGFKAAMEHSGITFVKLAGIPGGPVVPNPAGPELQTAITQNGPKTLIIEGDTDLYAPLGGRIDSLIAVTNTLSVMGNGRLTFYGGLSNAKNCVLRAFNTNSHITVGGTGNKPILIGKPNGNTYGRAITASMGKVTINDGKFEAHGNAHAVYALELDGDVKAEILGGEFYAENTSSEKANLGLSIQSETADVTIKGGRFTSGIRVHSSKQISDYLPAGYELRAISGDAPIGGNTTAITGGCYVMSAKEINKAVINVTEPAAGADRQVPTVPADSNTTIHNQGWTKLVDGTPQSFSGVFKAGETYRLEVVLVPDTTNGYSFTTNATATINGVTAKIVSSDTTRIHCYRDFKISGTSIQDVAIIVEEPAVGAKPAEPETTTSNTTVYTYEWSHGDDPFQLGQPRTLTVVVHPTDGAFFSDAIAPTINGKSTTIHMKGDDHVNFSYEFDMAATEINITVDEPVVGATPATPITTTPNTTVRHFEWTLEYAPFQAGETRRLIVIVDSTDGTTFENIITPKINGELATIQIQGDTFVNFYYEFTVGAPDPVIGHIDVSFTPPAAGGTIEKEVSSYTAAPNCEVTEVQWIPTDSGDWNTFTGGKKYRCTITVVPNEGFSFRPSGPQTTAKFNGIDADVMRIGVNSATYLYDYVIATPDPVIGHIDVSFTPPAAGGTIEKEVSSYTAAPNCEVTEVQWSPMDGGDWDTFTGGKKYRCTITIVPNEGFFFSSSVPQTTAKFNGIDADVMRIGVNSATYLYDYVISELGHTHEWASTWSSNTTHHWHECSCGDKADNAIHNFNDWTVTKEATETEDGSRERTCSDCSYKATETILAHSHTHTLTNHPAKAATQSAAGNTEYWSCSGCGKYFSDAAGTTEITLASTVIPKLSGGGSGGSSAPVQQTIPAANGAVQVSYTTDRGTATLTMPTAKMNEIIEKSKDGEAVIDLSEVSGTAAASLPKAALEAFEDAGLDVTVKLPAGTITLDQNAAASVADQATGNLTIELKQVANSALTSEQKEAVKTGDIVLDINIYSGTKKISNFDGTLTVSVPYTGSLPVAVWYLNDKGELEKLDCTFKDGLVTFTTDHLSLYVVGQDTAWVNPFTDVKEGTWYYESVQYVYENGLMMGTGKTTFGTHDSTTRAMIVTILHRLEGMPEAGANPFTDVAEGMYYTDAIAWAAENNIVSGYGNGKFGPEDSITREQLAVILMNYANFKGYDVKAGADLSKYNDATSVSSWASDAMAWANAEGFIQGDGVKLNPAGNAERCQVAAILQRFIEAFVK